MGWVSSGLHKGRGGENIVSHSPGQTQVVETTRQEDSLCGHSNHRPPRIGTYRDQGTICYAVRQKARIFLVSLAPLKLVSPLLNNPFLLPTAAYSFIESRAAYLKLTTEVQTLLK